MDEEIWKIIDGFPNYAVSNLGYVKNRITDHILRPGINGPGYYHVVLRRSGRSHTVRVHTLVAHHFIGPRPAGWEIDHSDGKLNNRWDKLEYVPPKENHDRKIARRRRGRKLAIPQVLMIKELLEQNRFTGTEIARMFGVTRAMISYIKVGHSWGQDVIGTS